MLSPNLQIKFERRFLLPEMPAPLTRASSHLQFFDNYLTETRLWLRQIRNPETKSWTRRFVQKYFLNDNDLSRLGTAEIELNEREYEMLSVFEANELRYNRYFFELETGEKMLVDMLLNRELWNLILATVEFADETTMREFAAPAFAFREVTQDKFFTGEKLVDANLETVKQHLSESKEV